MACRLSGPVAGIIRSIPIREERDLIFGKGSGSFSGWSSAKKALDRRILEARRQRKRDSSEVKPMKPWRLHDLRRTVATRLSDFNELPHVVEAVLNHISGTKAGVAGVYNRSLYAREKREALVMWGVHVTALTSGTQATILPIRRAT